MQNQHYSGDLMKIRSTVAAYTIGVPVLINGMLLMPTATTAIGDPATFQWKGVYSIAKTAVETPVDGARAYWDDTAKSITTVSAGNTEVGRYYDNGTVGASDATVQVNLIYIG